MIHIDRRTALLVPAGHPCHTRPGVPGSQWSELNILLGGRKNNDLSRPGCDDTMSCHVMDISSTLVLLVISCHNIHHHQPLLPLPQRLVILMSSWVTVVSQPDSCREWQLRSQCDSDSWVVSPCHFSLVFSYHAHSQNCHTTANNQLQRNICTTYYNSIFLLFLLYLSLECLTSAVVWVLRRALPATTSHCVTLLLLKT